MVTPRVGVLALQGDFAAHARMLADLGVATREIRQPAQLDELDGLVLPGGETTTMLKFMSKDQWFPAIHAFADRGGGFFGTCAGAILLAKEVSNPPQPSLGLLDIGIRRNAYGRQVQSFIGNATAPALGDQPLEVVFIRAPIIERVGPSVEVIAHHDGHPILIQQGRHLVATFHPELTADNRVHRRFLELLDMRAANAGTTEDPAIK